MAGAFAATLVAAWSLGSITATPAVTLTFVGYTNLFGFEFPGTDPSFDAGPSMTTGLVQIKNTGSTPIRVIDVHLGTNLVMVNGQPTFIQGFRVPWEDVLPKNLKANESMVVRLMMLRTNEPTVNVIALPAR